MNKGVKLRKPLAFEWDEGNKNKNVTKHDVENSEAEEVFFNDPVFLFDTTHSQTEERYFAFGSTDKGRSLIISFTLRGKYNERIRPIMVRDQNNREREYERQLRKAVKEEK